MTKRFCATSDISDRIKHIYLFTGYYMYMEASSPRKAGDVATMQTYYMPAADYCVVMYYHMSGVSNFTFTTSLYN